MSTNTLPEFTRISKGKKTARVINTKHNNLFAVFGSITSKGVFYVNCAFNWVAGMALGGYLLAFGSLFNDFSMRDYLHRIKEGDLSGGDKILCNVGFAVCALNSMLCLALCFFMMQDKVSNVNFTNVSAIEEKVSSLASAMKMSAGHPDNWAKTFQEWKQANSALADAKVEARSGLDYAPEHAIFQKTSLSKDWVTFYMAMAIFINAFISAWIEKEERTTDDLDENRNVIKSVRKGSKVLDFFGRSKDKPVVVAKAEHSPVT